MDQDPKDATITTIETDCSSSRRGTNETPLHEVEVDVVYVPGLNGAGAGARMSIPPRRMMVMVLVLSRSRSLAKKTSPYEPWRPICFLPYALLWTIFILINPTRRNSSDSDSC